MEANPRPLVLFHDQCADGIVAAWIVWRRYFENADYIAVRYGQEPPDCTDRLVYIVDFAYPPAVMAAIADRASRVIVIDHHVTMIEQYQAHWRARHDVVTVFDVNHSGAQLTARYFNANSRLWIVDYAEDRDLWKHELPDTHEVNALIATLCLGLPCKEAFQALEDLRAMPKRVAVAEGKGALRQAQAYARMVAAEAIRVTFAGYPNIPFVNCAKPLTSEVLHELDRDALFAVGWRQEGTCAVFSLRSQGKDAFNVGALAKLLGGGGHHSAAGFTLQFEAPSSWVKVFSDERTFFSHLSPSVLPARSDVGDRSG